MERRNRQRSEADPEVETVGGQIQFIEQTGVKLIVGKGGMGPETTTGCLENKAVHAVFPGGCAVLAATQVEEIERAEWQDLGMPETLWVDRVREFGPLIISIDTKGNNLFEQNKVRYRSAAFGHFQHYMNRHFRALNQTVSGD